MLANSTRAAIDFAWARRLGCRIEDLRGDRTLVVPHGPDLEGYFGVEALRRDEVLVVSAPAELVPLLKGPVEALAPAAAFHPEFLRELLGERVYRVVGPTWYGYADRGSFKAAVPREVRPLKPRDREALLRLAVACPPSEWEAAGFQAEQAGIFGVFTGAELAAVGRASRFAEGLVGIGAVTHPASRGAGYGKALVSALTLRTMEQDFVPQMRMATGNEPAIRLAIGLGYDPFGATLVARLR